jgi:hypothetical protein
MVVTERWDDRFATRGPMFEPLAPLTGDFSGSGHWPDLAALNRIAQTHQIRTATGKPIRFVAQGPRPTSFEQQYEPRIYLSGEVQTRAENWHDLFNALVWLQFPRTKAVINQRHFLAAQALVEAGHQGRGAQRDAATLFDESGVVVACSTPELAELLLAFKWKELFWNRREQTARQMRFVLFGHSLYEKALNPYVGMTGKGIVVPVEPAFLALNQAEQCASLDGMLARMLAEPGAVVAPRDLAPVPLLGFPGWVRENADEGYYDNVDYFRPGRRVVPG